MSVKTFKCGFKITNLRPVCVCSYYRRPKAGDGVIHVLQVKPNIIINYYCLDSKKTPETITVRVVHMRLHCHEQQDGAI